MFASADVPMRLNGALLALSIAAPLSAHVVSISTGELRVDGPTAIYELRMPMFEVAHITNPETSLIDHIHFAAALRTSSSCEAQGETYVCRAMYEFPSLIDRLPVECDFYQITVPNHVHLLYAVQGANSDQVVFDQSFPRSEIRFHPPSRGEVIARELGAGLLRAVANPAGLLFLACLVIAARGARESVTLAAFFLAGEWLAKPVAPRIPWQFSPQFIEAAMALTVAYLAVEMLLLPAAGQRWLVVFVLGLFHGLNFAGFPPPYLTGATAAQIAIIGALALAAWKLPLVRHRAAGWAMLAAGFGWFAWQLKR